MLTETTGVVIAEEQTSGASYVEWGPVTAGAVLASAISLVLFTFGGGVGLSISSPWPNTGAEADTLGVLTMGWAIVVMIFSFIAGGYIAGRLRKPRVSANDDETDFRDGAHGLVVWATGMLIGVVLAALLSLSAARLGATSLTSGDAADADRMLRGDETVDVDTRDLLAGVLAGVLADGMLTEEDRAYAASVIADSTDLTEQEAQTRVANWEAISRESADRARKIGAISAFLLAASAFVAAAGAYFAATTGGRHRDSNSPFPWTRARAQR